jgi:hypothetical protein
LHPAFESETEKLTEAIGEAPDGIVKLVPLYDPDPKLPPKLSGLFQ